METKIECLITTYNLSSEEILAIVSKMNLFCSAIVRNQTDFNSYEETEIGGHSVRIYNCIDRGLSKNRNEIIKLSEADYVIFCDDDIVFEKNAEGIIRRELNQLLLKHFRVDGVVFNIKSLNPKRGVRIFKRNTQKCRFKHVRSSGIWRFLLKRDVALSIAFDENIGSGTKYLCGEDTIFIHELLQNNKFSTYISKSVIGSISHNSSQWFDKRKTKEYLLVKGHIYKTVYPVTYRLYIVRFLCLERQLTIKNYKMCVKGAKEWQKILKEE